MAGLARGLEALGHSLELRPLRLRTGFHTLDRWIYNAGVAWSPPRDVALVYGVDLDGFLWARRRRLPFVVSLKGVIADELKNERGLTRALLSIQARWERLNARRADVVIAPSRYSANIARLEYGVEASRIAVVPEPIELERWTALFSAATPRPRAAPAILCVARMYPRKRIGDLLEAAALLRRRIPGARVSIVGKGPGWAEVARLHGALGLGETVALLGDVSRERLAEEYVSADIFCLPSVQESFGIVFLEAMAAGLPVVACRAAAIPEVVRDAVTGLLVPPSSPEYLAGALEALAADPGRARAMGDAGRRAVTAYAPERVAAQFLEAVRSCFEGGPFR
jgi:phosphatidylinositol alpha-1,6-mannosyltransferase